MRETQVKELCTYDKYLEGAYREGVLRRLLTSVLGEKSVMEKILVDKEVMVFPAHVCGGTHFVGIAIHPGRKIVGFWDGLFSVSVANEAKWKPALLAALAAAGEDVITWTFYSNLATTDQGELIQHDEITLPGDRVTERAGTTAPSQAVYEELSSVGLSCTGSRTYSWHGVLCLT